ncbi:MAG: hypothetical protein M3N52_11980 [Actinomycetota bacterium]|nr:hypothetical protein [Actinomycetota bacterium]
MASKTIVINELATRAKGVGWPVTRNSAGQYRITMPPCADNTCPHILLLHTSQSDRDGWKIYQQILANHGLDDLEARLAKERAADKAARLAAERKAANDRARRLASMAAVTAKAAGPYAVEPEHVDVDWFLTPHPAPWPRLVWMTPLLAKKIVDELNTDNRPINPSRVAYHANIVRSGQHRATHQGAAIDTRPVLQDGQHRLLGIHEADETVPIWVFVGMPQENYDVIDEGLVRTAAALFGKSGVKNGTQVAAIVRLTHLYRQDNPRRVANDRITNHTVLSLYEAHAEQFEESTRWAMTNARRIRGATAGPLGAAHFLIRQDNGPDNPYVEAFFRGLATERKLDPVRALDPLDPRIKVREYIENARSLGKRVSPLDALTLYIHCWNRVVRDERKQYFRLSKDTPIPRISLCRHSGELASAAPPLLAGEITPQSEE